MEGKKQAFHDIRSPQFFSLNVQVRATFSNTTSVGKNYILIKCVVVSHSSSLPLSFHHYALLNKFIYVLTANQLSLVLLYSGETFQRERFHHLYMYLLVKVFSVDIRRCG